MPLFFKENFYIFLRIYKKSQKKVTNTRKWNKKKTQFFPAFSKTERNICNLIKWSCFELGLWLFLAHSSAVMSSLAVNIWALQSVLQSTSRQESSRYNNLLLFFNRFIYDIFVQVYKATTSGDITPKTIKRYVG